MKQIFLFLFLVFGGYTLIAQAPNDECDDRATIIVNTVDELEYSIDTSTATESLDASCNFASFDNLDVWYEFEMPVNGNVQVTNIPNSVSISIYNTCGGAELACFSGNGFLFGLDGMTNYILRVSETSGSAGIVNFRIQAFETLENDECDDRELITVDTVDAIEYTVDTRAASESLDASCDFAVFDNLDAWYEFEMPVNGNVQVTNIPNSVSISIYDTCGGMELDCFTGNGFLFELDALTNYILRVSESSGSGGIVNFRIRAIEEIDNDECDDRINIIVNTTDQLEYTLDTSGATESLDASCDFAVFDNLDAWYEFEMPVNGNVRVTNIPNSVSISIYDSCGGMELDCFTNNGFLFGLDAMTSYILRVSESSNSSGIVNFRIQAFEEAPNDDCDNAIEIDVLEETALIVPYDNRAATESLDASCDFAIFDNLDLWYQFTMPVNGTIEISNVANSQIFSLYEECSGEELACFSNNGSFFELLNGASYLLRTSSSSGSSGPNDFTIQAVAVEPQPCTDSTTWNGSSWSNGVPDNTKSALFNGNYNTNFTNQDQSVNACSCTIASGNTVTIGNGFYLRSVFDITNEGTLNVANEGSIVQVAEDAITINNGSIEVSKTTPSLEARDFIILASPMSLEVNGEVYNNADRVFGIIEENFTPNTDTGLADVVANFIDDNGDYLDNLFTDSPDLPDDASGVATPIIPGTGYLVFPQAINGVGAINYDHNYTQGTLNSGVIERVATYNGPATQNNFNLLGNPYASAIDVNQFIASNDPINEVYYWEHITPPDASFPGFNTQNFTMDDVSVRNLMGGIASVNGGTDPGQFMSSGQGFAVLADQAFVGTNITFNNSMRVIANNSAPRSVEQENRLWLEMSSDIYTINSRALIGFSPEASAGMDLGYDSDRLDTSISLFSVLENGNQLSIQGREVFRTEMEIQLGITNILPEDLNLTIRINQLEGTALQQNEIYLIDKLLNTVTNLKTTEYTFTAGEGLQEDRFTLVFREAALNVGEESFLESNIKLYPNPASNNFTLDYRGNQQLTQLTVMNVNGQIVLHKDLSEFNGQQQINIQDLSAGMYFVNLESTRNKVTKKLIIK